MRGIDALPTSALYWFVGEGEVTQLVERVGGVGDELAEEDFRVRVERMDDELEELVDFSLELLFGHGIFDYCEPGSRFSTRQPVNILSLCCCGILPANCFIQQRRETRPALLEFVGLVSAWPPLDAARAQEKRAQQFVASPNFDLE